VYAVLLMVSVLYKYCKIFVCVFDVKGWYTKKVLLKMCRIASLCNGDRIRMRVDDVSGFSEQ